MATKAFLEQAYLAYFGRPIDPNGVAAYVNSTPAQVEAAFWASPESQALYGNSFGLQQINVVYNILFGRDAEPAGLTYWANQILIGALTPVSAAIGILNGAQGTDVTAVNNKLSASAMFTAGLDTTAEILGYSGNQAAAVARAFLATITQTPATQAQVDTAINASVAIGSATGGQTYGLTVNQDNLVGTTGNDIFNAPAAQNGAGTLIDTLQAVDVLNGGAGNDNLVATLINSSAPTLTNIENVNLRFAGGSLDLSNATGVTAVNVANSTASGFVFNTGSVAALSVASQNQDTDFSGGTAAAITLGLANVGTAAAPKSVTISNSKLTSETINIADSNVVLINGGGSSPTTLTINAKGTNTVTLTNIANTATSVTVTGDGSVDLTGAPFNGPLATFNGSASTGAIKVNVQSTKTAAITTGSGNDVVDVDTAVVAQSTVDTGAGNDAVYVGALLGNFKSVAGGAGTDIINITDGATWTAPNAALTSGFETLDVSGGSGAYDTSLVAFTTVQIDQAINGGLTGPVDLTKSADTSTLNVASKAKTNANFSVGDITVTLADATGTTAKGTAESTTVNVTINDGNQDNTPDGDVIIAKYTAAGVENVTVNSSVGITDGGAPGVKASAYSTTFTAAVLDKVETLTLTGTSSIAFTALTNAGNTLTKVNAGASSGNIGLDASAITTQIAYTGASGVDTYKASNGGSIYAGAGNDQISLVAALSKADTIIYKSASDVSFADTDANGLIDAGGPLTVENIAGFVTAGSAGANQADTVDVTTFGFTGYAAAAVNKGALAALNSGSFATNIADFFADAAGDRGVAFSTSASGTTVYVDVNKDGNWSTSTDLAIVLTGVANFTGNDVTF